LRELCRCKARRERRQWRSSSSVRIIHNCRHIEASRQKRSYDDSRLRAAAGGSLHKNARFPRRNSTAGFGACLAWAAGHSAMNRTFCAWLLVLLALSPFTAPFATCDLLKLLANETPSPRAVELARPVAAETTMDAIAGSTATERIQLSRPLLDDRSPSPANVPSVRAFANRVAATPISPPDECSLRPQQYSAELTVLRL